MKILSEDKAQTLNLIHQILGSQDEVKAQAIACVTMVTSLPEKDRDQKRCEMVQNCPFLTVAHIQLMEDVCLNKISWEVYSSHEEFTQFYRQQSLYKKFQNEFLPFHNMALAQLKNEENHEL